MEKTLIYIYGNGLSVCLTEIQTYLENEHCLSNISDTEDNKLSYSGDQVTELVFSENLDYIKFDAEKEVFESLVYYFANLLKSVNPKHQFSFGLSGDASDYKELPVFQNLDECRRYLNEG